MGNSQDTKLIIFDLGDVIAEKWETFHRLIPDIKNIDQGKIKEIVESPKKRYEFFLGKITEDQFIEEIKRITNTRASNSEIKNAIRSVMVEKPGMRYLLTQLKEKYKLALLSNHAKEWYEYFDMRYGIVRFFDKVFVSGITGVRKPDAIAYKQVLDFFRVKPSECLFIDDTERNIAPARELGMNTIMFKDAVSLKNDLEKTLKLEFPAPMSIFRSNDVRGIYGLDIDEGVAKDLGRTLGTYIGAGKAICVASDYRKGGKSLRDAFTDGALSAGVDVVDLSILPTPVYYFIIIERGLDGGAMSTASHNPPIWNGFKLCKKNAGLFYAGDGMDRLKDIFKNKAFASGSGKAKRTSYDGAAADYIKHVAGKVRLSRRLKVALDPGNGAWCGIARSTFEALGCEVFEINGKPDSSFSARGPDPNALAVDGLKRAVLEHGADFGAAFDADGDRVSFIDERGRFCGSGSVVLLIFASRLAKDGRLGKVVYDVPCSSAVDEVLKRLGHTPVMERTGHSFIMARMSKDSAIMGGEYSNHIYFPDNFRLDDGCFAAAKMAELLSKERRPLSELMDEIPTYPGVPIEEFYCPDSIKEEVVRALKAKFKSPKFKKIIDIDGIKAFSDDGWVLVRASGTMPQIKVNSEGKTIEVARELFEFAKENTISEISKHI